MCFLQTLESEDVTIKCMCVTPKHMWCADMSAVVHLFGFVSYFIRINLARPVRTNPQFNVCGKAERKNKIGSNSCGLSDPVVTS